jgi:hypothetical protein
VHIGGGIIVVLTRIQINPVIGYRDNGGRSKRRIGLGEREVGIEPIARDIRAWRGIQLSSAARIEDIGIGELPCRKGDQKRGHRHWRHTATILTGQLIGNLLTTRIRTGRSLSTSERIRIKKSGRHIVAAVIQ